MNLTIDTTADGTAFAVTTRSSAVAFENVSQGGGHYHSTKAGSAGGLRAMTLFSIFALRGRDNPSLLGRSSENYEQRMELTGGGTPAR